MQAAVIVELKKEDVLSANKLSLRRYIRSTYEARIDDEEEGPELKKPYIIQLLNGINAVNASIAYERKTTAKAQNEDNENTNKNEDPTAKTIVDDANEQQDINGADTFILRKLGMLRKNNLLHKKLIIRRQIGEGCKRDKLSYVSLMHQITEAKSTIYDKDDIVNSVIRAMATSL